MPDDPPTDILAQLRTEDAEGPWCGPDGLFQRAADEIELLRKALQAIVYISEDGEVFCRWMEGADIREYVPGIEKWLPKPDDDNFWDIANGH